jgi:hypothetical protein
MKKPLTAKRKVIFTDMKKPLTAKRRVIFTDVKKPTSVHAPAGSTNDKGMHFVTRQRNALCHQTKECTLSPDKGMHFITCHDTPAGVPALHYNP